MNIHASNAIREKNQSINFLRLSSRIEAVAGRCVWCVRLRVWFVNDDDGAYSLCTPFYVMWLLAIAGWRPPSG